MFGNKVAFIQKSEGLTEAMYQTKNFSSKAKVEYSDSNNTTETIKQTINYYQENYQQG